MRNSLILYSEWYEILRELPDEDRLQALDAILQYGFEDIEPSDKYIKAITALIFKGIDKTRTRYDEKCEKNRQKAYKRWNKTDAKNATACSGMQMDANAYKRIQTIPTYTNDTNYNYNNNYSNNNNYELAEANNKEIKENRIKEKKEKAHDFLDQFFSKDITIDQFCKHNKTNRQELREMAEGIVIEWDMAHIIHNDFEEACREMTNKLSYRLRNKKNMTSNPTNEIDNRPPCPGPGHVWSDPLQKWVYVK